MQEYLLTKCPASIRIHGRSTNTVHFCCKYEIHIRHAFGRSLKESSMLTGTSNPDLAVYAIVAVALLVLLLFFVVVFLYIGEKRRSSAELERIKDEWRADQMEILRVEQREEAQADARLQLEDWRRQELEAVKIQQAEIARREAQVEIEQWKASHSKEIRQDAIQKSQAVVTGKVTEHFVPYLPEFKFNPRDARFLGTPIDFVVFDGLDEGKVKRVVFIEVKTGTSQLTARERQVRNVVEAHSVEWLTIRPQLSQMSVVTELTQVTNVNGQESASIAGNEFDVVVDDYTIISH